MTSFYFLRHGKSQDNQNDVVSTPQTPLTKEGEAQARKAGRDLRGKGISVILVSPYPRARQTAEIVAKQLKLPPESIEVVDDLRERGLGQLEGRQHEHKHAWYFTVDGESDVEPRGMLIARCESALAAIKKAAQRGTVLAVGHTMCGYYLREVAAGKRLLKDFNDPKETPNGGFTKITIAGSQESPAVKPAARLTVILIFVAAVGLLLWGLYLKIWSVITPPPTTSGEQSIPLPYKEVNTSLY